MGVRIIWLLDECGFAADISTARDSRNDLPRFVGAIARRESTANDTLLDPKLSGCELAVGRKTCQFCTRAGSARRSVLGSARTVNEISAVGIRCVWWPKELDVVDQSAVATRDFSAL